MEIDRKQDKIVSMVEKVEKLVKIHEKEKQKLNQDYTTLKCTVNEVKIQVQQKFNPELTLVVTNPPNIPCSDYLLRLLYGVNRI